METIDVNIVTWPNHPKRIEYFRHMLATVRARLSASRHHLLWHCSSESQRDPQSTWHGDELEDICTEAGISLNYRFAPASLGGNMNAALRLGDSRFVFLVQDDFELLYDCDLSPGAELLDAQPDVDLIRYGWPPMTQRRGEVAGWPLVDICGPWPYGDEPQLRRRDFASRWGEFMEGHRHGASEGDMLFRLVNGRACIVLADRMYFGNFGAVSAVPVDQEYRPREIQR